MRLNKMICVTKRRRGMSFVEVVSTMIVVALLVTMLVAMMSVIRTNMRDTLSYTTMKTYAVNKIEQIQIDLENGAEIDTLSYNDTGESSGIQANVYIRDVGSVFGVPLYHVEINMTHVKTDNITTTQTMLRKGCLAHAP